VIKFGTRGKFAAEYIRRSINAWRKKYENELMDNHANELE
jgi:hypothetical protein